MKIVLATAPEEWVTKKHLPPLSLGYIAAILEEEGYDVVIVDAPAHTYSIEETSQKIIKEKPDAIGVTATTHNRFSVTKLCDQIKDKSSALIFVGGPHFTFTAREALENVKSIEVVVRGEGELTVKELLKTYFEEGNLKTVLGITYRDKNGQIIETPGRPFIQNLDAIPMPAWHLFPLNKYDAVLEGEYKTRSIGVICSRGCPYSCVFCANRALWKNMYRKRGAKKFVDEIEFLHRQYGFDGFDVWDDTLTISKEHVSQICNEIIDRKLDITWYARARVDTIDKEMITLMRKSGCRSISFGVESGSQRILNNIKKDTTISQIKAAVRMAADLDYYIKVFLMFSLPGETVEDIKKTLHLKDELCLYGTKVSIMRGFTLIYPGTELETLAKGQSLLPPNFSWNRYHEFPKNKLFRGNITIPPYESPALPLEKILEVIDQDEYRLSRLMKQGIKRLLLVRDLDSLKDFLSKTKAASEKKWFA